MRVSEKERLIELYFCLKSVPPELWNSQHYHIVQTALQDKKLTKEHCLSFHIFGKLAHHVEDEIEFVKCIKGEDLPDLSLTQEEETQLNIGAKQLAKMISKGRIGGASDSLKIFQYYYASAA